MTNITVQKSGRVYRLTAVGHATGSREVCAAVSGIVYALGGYLKNLEQRRAVEMGTFLLESGAAEIEAYSIGPQPDAAQHAFGMTAVGLMQIEKKYPKQVTVDIKNFPM